MISVSVNSYSMSLILQKNTGAAIPAGMNTTQAQRSELNGQEGIPSRNNMTTDRRDPAKKKKAVTRIPRRCIFVSAKRPLMLRSNSRSSGLTGDFRGDALPSIGGSIKG